MTLVEDSNLIWSKAPGQKKKKDNEPAEGDDLMKLDNDDAASYEALENDRLNNAD